MQYYVRVMSVKCTDEKINGFVPGVVEKNQSIKFDCSMIETQNINKTEGKTSFRKFPRTFYRKILLPLHVGIKPLRWKIRGIQMRIYEKYEEATNLDTRKYFSFAVSKLGSVKTYILSLRTNS